MGRSRKRKHSSNFNNKNIEQKGGWGEMPEENIIFNIFDRDKNLDTLTSFKDTDYLNKVGKYFEDTNNHSNITLFLDSLNSSSDWFNLTRKFFNSADAIMAGILSGNFTQLTQAYQAIVTKLRLEKLEIIKIIHEKIHGNSNTDTVKQTALKDLFDNTTTRNMLKKKLDSEFNDENQIHDTIDKYYNNDIKDPENETLFETEEKTIRDIITKFFGVIQKVYDDSEKLKRDLFLSFAYNINYDSTGGDLEKYSKFFKHHILQFACLLFTDNDLKNPDDVFNYTEPIGGAENREITSLLKLIFNYHYDELNSFIKRILLPYNDTYIDSLTKDFHTLDIKDKDNTIKIINKNN